MKDSFYFKWYPFINFPKETINYHSLFLNNITKTDVIRAFQWICVIFFTWGMFFFISYFRIFHDMYLNDYASQNIPEQLRYNTLNFCHGDRLIAARKNRL